MKKFFISFEKEKILITEVLVKKLTALDDPTVLWSKEDRYQVLSLNIKPIWYSFYLFDSIKEAKDYCIYLITEDFILSSRKNKRKYSEQELENKIFSIETKLLK